MSAEGGSKTALASEQETIDLSKFLFLADNKSCDITNITRMDNITIYLNELKKSGVGPSGQLSKLITLQHALHMLVSQIPPDGATADQLKLPSYMKVIELKLGGLMKSLRKEGTVIRKRKRDLFDTETNDHQKVITFLGNKKLLTQFQALANKDTLTAWEQLNLRRYLVCKLVYENSQRTGTVINMKLEELARARCHTTSDGRIMFVYKVWEHKTSAQFGSANIVAPEHLHESLLSYVDKHRPHPQPENKEFVFLTPGGRLITNCSEDLRLLSKAFSTEHGELRCTPTKMRKLTSTQVAKESKEEATIQAVATHMTHSTDTAKHFYQQLQSTSASVKAFDLINRKQPELPPPPPLPH